MKKFCILLICLCIHVLIQAQVYKTIDVTTPGTIHNLLTLTEMNTTTNLTVTGTINKLDFNKIAASMPALLEVDLSATTVAAYDIYPANTIPREGFSQNHKITTVILPSTVTTIETIAFSGCIKLESVTIPNSVITIKDYVFSSCYALKSIVIPNSVTSIGENSFEFSGLRSITIPSSITEIAPGLFESCDSLAIINFPSTITKIGSAAFSDCISLKGAFTIPPFVDSIGTNAFYRCTGITSINIPTTVTTYGDYVFYNCTGLTSINVYNSIPVNLSKSTKIFYGVNKTTCVLHVPVGSWMAYKTAAQWQDFNNVVEDLPTSEKKNLEDKIKIWIQNGKLILSGTSNKENVIIYNTQGVSIYNDSAKGEEVSVTLPAHGVYVVWVGNESVKVVY